MSVGPSAEDKHLMFLWYTTTCDSIETIGDYYNLTAGRIYQILRQERAQLPSSKSEKSNLDDYYTRLAIGNKIQRLRDTQTARLDGK